MKLTQEEKQVLTLLDEEKVEGFEKRIKKYIKLSKKEIREIVQKLKKLELIEIISLSDKKDTWFFHTKKVNEEILDENLRYKRNYGTDKHILTSSDNLEKKVRPE